ncbi:hypothetical protein CTAYLR_003936 [Chrysophaeum taylorii]|uniref:protein-tyrosine-phosphatase n=1 Tax=Chrysophaeum taylorii TaxID=2483200 RepID=A0AAD7UAB7_9STRA|nr:hypothetical protein CTAYLR_003936 [Chrysophaeum taylorii]
MNAHRVGAVTAAPQSPNINRSWALAVGSDAMQERVHSLLAYQKRKAKLPRRKVRNFAQKLPEEEPLPVDPDEEARERAKLELVINGCSLQGLRIAEGIEEFRVALQAAKKRAESEAAEEGDFKKPRIIVAPDLELFVAHPTEPIRAIAPGWDPKRVARDMLERDAEKMSSVFREHNATRRHRRNADKRPVSIHRPGPVVINKYEYLKHVAKSEGLSYDEWRRQQDLKDEQATESKKQMILEERRTVEVNASDPRPSPADLLNAEAAVVRHRRGDDAIAKAAKRRKRMERRWRRCRSFLTINSMIHLRSQGMGLVYEEQDAFFVETDLVFSSAKLAKNRTRLLDLGVTHIVKITSDFSVMDDDVEFPDDFIYCRVEVSDAATQPQDRIKLEYEMGRRFIAGGHAVGGRVLICCDDGINRSPALVVAYLLWERDLCLKTAYRLVVLHDPDIRFGPSISLFLSLLEIEVRHSTSDISIGLEVSSSKNETDRRRSGQREAFAAYAG